MIETESLSSLIGDVYDAAIDPARWPLVLANIARFVGGYSASLFVKDACSKSGNIVFNDGALAPHYIRLYFERYIKLDPCTTGQFFAEIGKPIATDDIVPYAEFLQTRFYKEWAKPQGLVDFLVTVLDKSATSAALCGVFRHERDGIADAASRKRMRLVAPHVRRAVLIGKIIDLRTIEATNFAETFDALNAGIFLIDAGGRIVHANAAGHVILETADYLRAVDGRLAASDQHADQVLRDSFSAGEVGVDGKQVVITLAEHGGDRHLAYVLPLTSGARRRFAASHAASVALFVHKASLTAPALPEMIAKTYKLTPMELRVLLAIVEVGGAPAVAEALGVAETTVKTHLRGLYEKTGAHRHADLVKLVAGFSNPLLR